MNKKGFYLLQKIKLPAQFQYILLLYLALMLFFAFFRFLFQVSFHDQFYNNVSFIDILISYLIGFRFDQIIILALLTPFLLLLPWFDFTNRKVKIFISLYSYIIFPIIFLGMIADIRFYDYFNIRLNFMAYEYSGNGNLGNNYVFADRFFWEYIAIWFVVSALFIFTHFKLIQKCIDKIKPKITSRVIWLFCFLILFTAGIRGRVALAPMDWGIAYFSDNHTLNQSALNGIYTLIKNFTETDHDPRLSFLKESERFPFVSRDSALAKVKTMLQQNGTTFTSDNSLAQSFSRPKKFDFQPNIIITVMESWSGSRTSALGAKNNLTPYFDSLTQHGILFENFYANGFRTNFGLGAVLCSYPAIPGRSILKRYESRHPFTSLSETLHTKGYYNAFCYGGDLAFDNMEGFFRTKKYDAFYGEKSFASDDSFSKWGVPDHILFHHINKIVDSLPRPFQVSIMTLSNHEPFDIPDSSVIRYTDKSYSAQKANGIVYADYALGQFMREMKTKPIFDSTIFIFVSDHSLLEGSKMVLDPNLFHIPLLIYSPSLLGDTAVRIDKIGSQVDIIPTLLGLIGGQYEIECWGRDLLHLPDSDSGFAFIDLWDRMGYIDNNYFYFEQLGQYTKLYANKSPEFTEADTIKNMSALLYCRDRLRRYTQLADQLTLQVPIEK